MIVKEVKCYENKKSKATNCSILIAKKDKLEKKVIILNPSEYNQLIQDLETIKKENHKLKDKINKNKIDHDKNKEILENLNINLENIVKSHNENLEKINHDNNQHIDTLNKEHLETVHEYDKTINILLTSLRIISNLGFIDILKGRSKAISNKTINEVSKESPAVEIIRERNN
jgi:predicted nuclease with TOPRIM domain